VTESTTNTWIIYPRSAQRPIDRLYPMILAKDYREATRSWDASPRMSAVLSRRVLGEMLKRYAGFTDNSLNAQVTSSSRYMSQPRRLREGLHHLRRPEILELTPKRIQATGEIIDVDETLRSGRLTASMISSTTSSWHRSGHKKMRRRWIRGSGMQAVR